MKAAVFQSSKGLVIEEIPVPQINKDQVLIKVSNTGFCGSDHSFVENPNTPDGIILGHEVSGVVVEMGVEVKNVTRGMRVIIRPTFCGNCPGCLSGRTQLCSNNRRSIGIGDLPGGFAEYVVAFPQMLLQIPSGLDSQNAALAEPFAVALHAVNVSRRREGTALIVGAGAIGLSLVKVLKLLGYSMVVVSEPVAYKRQMALDFGADEVIDPLNENLLTTAFGISDGVGFQSVFECSGVSGLINISTQVAAPGGVVCQVSVLYEDIAINPANLMFKEVQYVAAYGNTHEENFQCLDWMQQGLLEGKDLVTDIISLDQLPQVYRSRINTGKAVKVMIQIGEEF